MNNKLYGNLIFELSKEGRKGYSLPKNNYGSYEIPAAMKRACRHPPSWLDQTHVPCR